MVKTSKSGAPGGLSRLKYKCKVCDVHLRGCDLTKHYERNINWLLLSEMRSCVGKGAIEELKKRTDDHTLFMFENKYTHLFLSLSKE